MKTQRDFRIILPTIKITIWDEPIFFFKDFKLHSQTSYNKEFRPKAAINCSFKDGERVLLKHTITRK